MAATQNDAIAALQRAEKQAAEKVNEARKRKVQRLKQAKDEAKLEVDRYREEREKQFKENEEKICGSRDAYQSYITEMINKDLETQEAKVRANKEKAIDKLLQAVFNIAPELHVNFKSQQHGGF